MKTMKNRVSALFVALVMMLSLFTVGAMAWGDGQGLDVYWNDEKVATVTYDTMEEHAQGYPAVTYSNNKGEYTGIFYKFSKVLSKANKSEDWAAAAADTSVVFEVKDKDGSTKTAELTKAQLEESRYYFDKDGKASEKPVDPGFMHVDGESYYRFVIGQKTADDSTSGSWVKLDSTENAKLKINTPTTPDPSDDEKQTTGFEVYWNDKNVGTVTYDDMVVDGVSKATSTVTYSAVNKSNTRSEETGYLYKFTQLLEAVKMDEAWEAASDDLTTVVFETDKPAEFTKKELTEDRYYFDEGKTPVDKVKPGFLTETKDGKSPFKFVFGQKAADEVNKNRFSGFPSTGLTQVRINTPDVKIVDANGKSTELFYTDLQTLWESEGSKKYTYTSTNTYPSYTTEEYYGPTLKTVLAKAGIDLDALGDNDVIRFDATDGRGNNMTVKEIKRTRYAFPNGKSSNNYKGTTAAQYTDKTEVPFILSLNNGRTNIRNIFGMVDPQEQQMSYFIKYINKITVTKDGATEYSGMTPTIPNGGKYYKGAKLNYDLDLPAGVYEGAIYYTVSSDGTEPKDPTYADTMYNWSQNRTDDKDYLNPAKAKYYNIYEFTDAPKTIVKVVCYVSGYLEPTVKTYTYTLCTDHVAAETVKENEKEATCTEEGSYDEVVYCSECHKELSRETKTVAKIPHDFKDGKCTVCGTADPDYKPVSKFTGLADAPDANGDWWYYTDGEIDKNHTGVDQNKNGWWRVENGKVNFKAQGIYQNKYGWWKTTDGEVTFKENSIYQNEHGWWKCKDSKVDFTAQSIYQNKYGWWKTTDGKVTFKENGLFSNQYGTWKVENSKVNFDFNGKYQGKTIKNGKVV